MKETASPDINQRFAGRVRDLRSARGQSLETLAQQSGVSRSMISAVERGERRETARPETGATGVGLETPAASLGVSLAALFEDTQAPVSPIAPRKTQPQWRD